MTGVERRPLRGQHRSDEVAPSRVAGAARVVAALVLTALAGLVVAALASPAVGFSAHVVTSGSMAPRVEPGDVVLTRATTTAELRPGQVLLFADPARPGGLLLHRLVSFDPAGRLVTRGDANQSDDSVHVAPAAVRGVAQVRVPWVGLPSVWRAEGRFGPIALAAALLAGAAVFVHSGRGRRLAANSGPDQGRPGSSAGSRAPMTGLGARSIEEGRDSASTVGYYLPPVPPAVGRAAGRGDRVAGPAGGRHRSAGDHSGCFDGGRFCGQPGR